MQCMHHTASCLSAATYGQSFAVDDVNDDAVMTWLQPTVSCRLSVDEIPHASLKGTTQKHGGGQWRDERQTDGAAGRL